jgi:uncharacterized integral membrane protein
VQIASATSNFCGLGVKNLLLILNADNVSQNNATFLFSYCRLLIFMLFELKVSTINIAKVVLGTEVLELKHHLRATRKM